MKTRKKISNAALQLFNEKGERNITTNHIATHLQISPGNLYYHFQNKQEIVRDIFCDYATELLALFAPIDDQSESIIDFKHYLDSIFTLMWKYRFLYINLPQILEQDKLLHKKYLVVQEKSKKNLQTIFKSFITLQLINIEDRDIDSIITSLHLIISNWFSYQSTISLKSDISEQMLRQGMLQMTGILKAFSTIDGKQLLISLEEDIRLLN
jgi:AcrR family transcriptional regulator